MSDIQIRPMADADRDAVIGLLHELNLFEDALTGDRAQDRSAAVECLEENDGRVAKGGAQLVAERGGRVLGYLCFVHERAPAYVRLEWRDYGAVVDLVVAEAARGQGLGRALIAAAETLARAAGFAHLGIGHVVGNEGAGRLYLSLGFRLQSVDLWKRLDAPMAAEHGGPALDHAASAAPGGAR